MKLLSSDKRNEVQILCPEQRASICLLQEQEKSRLILGQENIYLIHYCISILSCTNWSVGCSIPPGLWEVEGEAMLHCVGRSDGESETKEENFHFNKNIFSEVILLIKNHLSEAEYPQYKLLQLWRTYC